MRRLVVVVVALLLEGHEIDEEGCGEQCRLEFDVEVDEEGDGEVVRLCTTLLTTTRPQFVHRADLTSTRGEHLQK